MIDAVVDAGGARSPRDARPHPTRHASREWRGRVGAPDITPGDVRRAGAPVIRPVIGRRERAAFVRLPWRIYDGDPAWVPPLMHDVNGAMNRAKHPFHAHAEVEYFLAWRGRRTVGRIAAIINHRSTTFHDDRVAFFGLFECENDDVAARALLDAAETWARERGMSALRGPMNLSTNDELYSPGVLIDGFARPPSVLMAHSPRYYAPLLEAAGYTPAKDLLAYWLTGTEPPERLVRGAERIAARVGVTVRPLDMRRFESDVSAVQQVYNAAWEQNWGFVPMTDSEISHMAQQLRPVVSPTLCAIAEKDGEPVGFILGLPDFNQALRHVDGRLLPFGILKLLWHRRKIDAIRVLTLGLKPAFRNKGLDALLILHIWREGVRLGHPRAECSWILEDNWEMRRGLERIGAHVHKTYRVYEKTL